MRVTPNSKLANLSLQGRSHAGFIGGVWRVGEIWPFSQMGVAKWKICTFFSQIGGKWVISSFKLSIFLDLLFRKLGPWPPAPLWLQPCFIKGCALTCRWQVYIISTFQQLRVVRLLLNPGSHKLTFSVADPGFPVGGGGVDLVGGVWTPEAVSFENFVSKRKNWDP